MKEEIIKRLIEKVEGLTRNQGWFFKDYCKETLQFIIDSKCDENKKIIALTQLYRFAIYERWYFSRDGKAHIAIKRDILWRIEKYVNENDILLLHHITFLYLLM